MANGPSLLGSPYSTATSAPFGTAGGAADHRISWGVRTGWSTGWSAVWAPAGGTVPARIRAPVVASAAFVAIFIETSLPCAASVRPRGLLGPVYPTSATGRRTTPPEALPDT